MKSLLSSQAPRFSGLVKVLDEIIQSHGDRLFTQLAKNEMATGVPDPTIIPTLEEFLRRTRNDFDGLQYLLKDKLLPSGTLRPFHWLKAGLTFLNQSGGFLFSWVISQRDIEFCARNTDSRSIYIHRPLVVALTIFLSWFSEVLVLAESHPAVNSSDKKLLSFLKNLLCDFKMGFQTGVYRKELFMKFIQSVRFAKQQHGLVLKVDPQLFAWLEIQLTHIPV